MNLVPSTIDAVPGNVGRRTAAVVRFITRSGMAFTLLSVTLIVLLLSHIACALAAAALGTHASWNDLVIGTIVPVAITPPLAYFYLSLLFQVEAIRERLEHACRTDPLTGTFNRGYFHQMLAIEFEKAARYDLPLSLAILDLDNFKKINDMLGHGAGDAVLQETTSRCVGLLRGTDVIGRIGGEEFAILFPCTDIASAKIVMERVRAQVAAHPVLFETTYVPVTLSAGVTELRSGDKAEDLLRRADKYLYSAKNGGRDLIVAAA